MKVPTFRTSAGPNFRINEAPFNLIQNDLAVSYTLREMSSNLRTSRCISVNSTG